MSCLLGLVGCDSDPAYRGHGGRWTYEGSAIAPEDETTFQPLDARFARDRMRGYYRGSVIADSDGASFEVLSEHEARDRRSVYWCDTYRKGQEYWSIRHLRIRVVDGADPATYRVLVHDYARDATHVYAEGSTFTVRDVASFEPLDDRFARDVQRGYHDRIEIAGSDGASFAVIDAHLARDRSHVYFAESTISGATDDRLRGVRILQAADVVTFHALGRGYAADARHVWYDGRLVRGADPGSFRIDESYVGDADADDVRGRWLRGERVVAAAKDVR